MVAFTFSVYAQTFQGPCGNPPSGNCGILFASSTRALQIGTSTVYSTAPQLLFMTQGGSNQHIIFLPNGNVGIGTSTPGQLLDVYGTVRAINFLGQFSGAVTAGNVSAGVFGSLQGNGNYAFPANLGVATSSAAGLPQALSVQGGGYFSGNVGIGTPSPSGRLDIAGTSGTVRVDTTGSILDFTFNGTNSIRGTGGASSNLSLQAGGTITLVAGGLGGASDIFIDSAGNVGIGTSTPMVSAKFIVDGTAYVNNQLSVRGINMLGGTNITMNGGNITGANKITVTTLDPLYDIQGTKYATYAPSITGGVYEEFVGSGTFKKDIGTGTYEFLVDFDRVPEGSDLWVWRHAVDFSKENVSVFMTPYGTFADTYYVIEENRIVMHANTPADFSFRLVGKRFDWKEWPTRAENQEEPASLFVR